MERLSCSGYQEGSQTSALDIGRRHIGRNPEAHAPAPKPLSASGMAPPVAGGRPAAAALPQGILRQLTRLIDQAPDGPDWLHEIKFDGCRMHARLDRGRGSAADAHGARLTWVLKSRGLDRHFSCF